MKKWFAIAVGVVACGGNVVDLGGRPGATPDDGGAPSSLEDAISSDDGAITNDPSAITAPPGTCPYPVHSSACVYTGACSDGSGYFAFNAYIYEAACSTPTGPPVSFMSASQVTAAISGLWAGCNGSGSSFVHTLDQNASGIQLASDGHFTLLTGPLIPANGGADTGTFEVVDASASLGPNTYQLRLAASNGGVYTTQVVVVGSEPTLRFFAPAADDYGPAQSKKFQAGVCGAPFGPVDTPSSGADALARLQGKWVLCGNSDSDISGEGPLPGEGLEFPGDGTVHFLYENAEGVLARDPNARLSQIAIKAGGSSPALLTITAPNGSIGTLQPVLGVCGTLSLAYRDDPPPNVETYMRVP
jgi:hypothetical protein